jgi:hypothetical protein
MLFKSSSFNSRFMVPIFIQLEFNIIMFKTELFLKNGKKIE